MLKNESGYLVVLDFAAKGDTLRTLEVLYSGPDRSKARAAAEKNLNDADAPVSVLVMRVTRSVTLTDDSLVASLPRTAF